MNSQPTMLEPIGPVQGGCLCCPPKPATAPLDWQPHPGFGALYLTRDGETPEWWHEYCDLGRRNYYPGEWKTGTRKDGSTYEWFTGSEFFDRPSGEVTLAEIEECAAEDPDHDWRLEIHGPLSGVTYQRQGCGQWVAVEKNMGFA